MKKSNNIEQVVQAALAQLALHTACAASWTPSKEGNLDGKIALLRGGRRVEFQVTVKTVLLQGHFGELVRNRKESPSFLLIAGRISKELGAKLKALQINYLDAGGNAWIATDDLFILIEGMKANLIQKRDHLFTKASIQLIFHLLAKPGLLMEPYRSIAAATGASLDNISKTFRLLRGKKYIMPLKKGGFQWSDKDQLADRWAVEYGERLKPGLFSGRYRLLKGADWKEIALDTAKSQWSGEPGAELLLDIMRPEVLTLYTTESREELIQNYRLVPDPEGAVEVFRAFWDMPGLSASRVAPSLLVYADLLLSGSQRNIEIAKRLRDGEEKANF